MVTHIRDLDKYVAQCYGKNQMINIFYNELNRFSFQQNKLLTSYKLTKQTCMFIFNYAFDFNQLQLFMGPIYLYRWHPTMSDHDMHEVCQFHLTALHPMLLVLNIKSNIYITLIIV